MSVFHRKHSNPTKSLPVILSLERSNNDKAGSLAEEQQSQVEEIAEEVTAKTGSKTKIPKKTIEHVKSYPLVQQTRTFLYQLPVARVFIANTKPVVKNVLESKPLQLVFPVTSFVDNVANSSLNLTEKVVPALRTKTYEGLKDDAMVPCKITVNFSKKTATKTVSIVDKNVYKPSHAQVLKFRKYYNEKFYDTKGKPLVRSTLNPITAPINNIFEKLTNRYFPEGQKVPAEGYSSELNRSVALAFNFVHRSYPVLQKNVVHVSMIPCHYAVYINQVFNESLNEQPNLKPKYCWNATRNALRRIRKESISNLKRKTPNKIWKNKTSPDKSRPASVHSFQDKIKEVEARIQTQFAA